MSRLASLPNFTQVRKRHADQNQREEMTRLGYPRAGMIWQLEPEPLPHYHDICCATRWDNEMVHTQIHFRDEQLSALQSRATRDGVSISALVRQAVDAWAKAEFAEPREDRLRRALDASGRFASGLQDVAEKHDAYLADDFRK